MKKFFALFCFSAVIMIAVLTFRENESVSTIKFMRSPNIEDLVDTLINDVYGGVEFKKIEGFKNNFEKRYFCSNLCIDVCKDGTVRYLCDITANSNEDLFLRWLYEKEKAKVIEEREENGAIYKKIVGASILAELYVNPQNDRVFAAIISIKI